ncbi:cupin domain-containing protein [Parasphingorhabdus cellanae]|uniref:Cupin domain-containing protein n=2 Tax=Parasphingorhabdus cellanae TaxID=2806553 RepID=A0ABX7T981_9SPHN|nr:cupin domain-containing protein [Parasphingorhabdus cellanae]
MHAADIIKHFEMKPHPEGGHFVETFRDDASTAIYFLLEAGEYSHWHRVHGSAELWHHYAGDPLELVLSSDGEERKAYNLGLRFERGERPMIVVPAGCWQMARSLGAWTLVGCTVAPGFDFKNFEMASPDWQLGMNRA